MLLNQTLESKTIARIVAEDFRTVQVFEEFGLDFCCKGKRQLNLACSEKGISISDVLKKLESLNNEPDNTQRYGDWNTDFLIDYIIQQHHSFVKTMIPMIQTHLQKVVNAHSAKHPEESIIQDLFVDMSNELISHLTQEETVVFPMLKKIVSNLVLSQNEQTTEQDFVKFIENLEKEHLNVGKILEEIQLLTNEFTPPPGACTTFRVLYQELQAFQADMFRHIHLENNIVFPKIMEMVAISKSNSISNNLKRIIE